VNAIDKVIDGSDKIDSAIPSLKDGLQEKLKEPVWVEPDLEFINSMTKGGPGSFKMCVQCGTCSGTCTLTPDKLAFPCKEMAWVAWGMKDRLLKDPDIWLCFQCNDCSARCPRGARPGDVLGSIRQKCVEHYAVPSSLGRWLNQPQSIPLLLGIPAAILAFALVIRKPVESLLGIAGDMDGSISFAYSSLYPHWLLNSIFGVFTVVMLLCIGMGVRRFWGDLKENALREGKLDQTVKWSDCIKIVLKDIIFHEKFKTCEKSHIRYWSHTAVFYGFIALTVVTLWVITAKINPLINSDFVYPFGFWNPWKMLANAGGVAVLAGCILMAYDRLKEKKGKGSYFDWALLATFIAVILTGFSTEVLHYLRLDPHRHIVYFVHLVFVFALIMYLPYSKFAHVFYRTAALLFAEYSRREGWSRSSQDKKNKNRSPRE